MPKFYPGQEIYFRGGNFIYFTSPTESHEVQPSQFKNFGLRKDVGEIYKVIPKEDATIGDTVPAEVVTKETQALPIKERPFHWFTKEI